VWFGTRVEEGSTVTYIYIYMCVCVYFTVVINGQIREELSVFYLIATPRISVPALSSPSLVPLDGAAGLEPWSSVLVTVF
jgi:hypothetical protein